MKQINAKITAKDLNVYYGDNHALKGVNLEIKERQVTSLIGPSGCGKSTFLKSLNRLIDLVPRVRVSGEVYLGSEPIFDSSVDVTLLRSRVGMVFQNPNPFPMSIYDNIAYGPRIHGVKNRIELDEIVKPV